MSGAAREMAAMAFFVVTGWIALWPARGRLGARGYHLAALPAGLLSAAVAGALSTLTGRPLDLATATSGALVLAALVQTALRTLANAPGAPRQIGARTFAFAGGAIGVVAGLLGIARITVTNNDSVMSYWPLGVELARTGAFTEQLVGSRSALIPGMNAIHIGFGSDWAYVIYPLLAATLLGWLLHVLLEGPLARTSGARAWRIAGVAALALAIEPSFLFHSFFVHSHMFSALYLFMSVTCIWIAARESRDHGGAGSGGTHLLLAGLFAAGFALSRPDGLAYVFAPIAVALGALSTGRVERRRVAAFFAPLLGMLLVVYGATYAELGMWASSKLSGKTTLAILLLMAASAAGPWIIRWLDAKLPFRVAGEHFLRLLVSVAAAAMVLVLAAKWDTASGALANARINLFGGAGGYHYLWYGIVLLLVVSVFTRDATRPDSWTRPLFFAIVLFFIVALTVHGVSHEGRLGVGDSLNRVAFHAIPLIVLYLGAVAARVLEPAGTSGDSA